MKRSINGIRSLLIVVISKWNAINMKGDGA